jgi:hypothetical protein
MKTASAVQGFVVSVLLVLAVTCQSDTPATVQPRDLALEVGRPFPEIVLPSLADGRPAAISQFRGQKLLLHLFASW